jgi:hypothetical protein
MSVAEETGGKFEVSECTRYNHYYEIPEEQRICEIQLREGVFFVISLMALMLSIIICGQKLLGSKLITLNTIHFVFIVDLLL